MKRTNAFDVGGTMPPWLHGLGLALLFGLVLFGDAIMVWLS